MENDFHGAKAAVFIGNDLLIYQRDNHVPWPNMWDFPGGGREAGETPFACVQREIREEFGLSVDEGAVFWRDTFKAMRDPNQTAWFFVTRLPKAQENNVKFGSEGQRWALMPLPDVLKLPDLIPTLRSRLTHWLHQEGEDSIKTVGQTTR